MNLGILYYRDMPVSTLAERITKIKLIKNISNRELARKSGISHSAIDALTSGCRQEIKRDTLKKLVNVLGIEICDDYLKFILNQEENLKKYDKRYLIKTCCVDRSTVERWISGKYTIKRKYYFLLKRD